MNESSNSEYVRAFRIASESSELTFFGDEEIVNQEIIKKVETLFKIDPRIASISVPKSKKVTSLQLVKCLYPDDINIFLNRDLEDLVGNLPLNLVLGAEIAKWNNEATRRGLHHYSLVSGPMLLATNNEDPTETPLTLESAIVSRELNSDEKPVREPLRVLVDCEWIRENETGSQVATISLISELNAHTGISAIGLLNWPPEVPNYASRIMGLEKVSVIENPGFFKSDIFWRPYQPSLNLDFFDSSKGSRRHVITILDSISYNNESYFQSEVEWKLFRDMFHSATVSADMVVCISKDVKTQLELDGHGVEAQRIRVAELGTNHVTNQMEEDLYKVEDIDFLEGQHYVLIIGSKYSHKNVDFGVKVVSEVRRRNCNLSLVIVGLKIDDKDENIGQLGVDWIYNLNHVDSTTRNLLIKNASVVLYPTSAEGFGLVPFEAARLNTPTAATRFGPMTEVLPSAYSAKSWNLDEYVSLIVLLASSSQAAKEQISYINSLSESMTWGDSAEKLIDAFNAALQMPKNPVGGIVKIFNHQIVMERDKSNSLQKELDFLKVQLESESNLNTALKASFSWKITTPIRALHGILTGR